MNLVQDNWQALSTLQRSLKKQFLLVEKEQQQKVKLKRQIQDMIRSYHRYSTQLFYPGGEVLKEQGFDNCYNFIKDVVVTVSTDYRLGRLILLLAEEQSTLPQLVVHGLYENIQTNDAFVKEITKLMHCLVGDLGSGELLLVNMEKVIGAWRIYMEKMEIQAYFQQIAESTLTVLLRETPASLSLLSPTQKNPYRKMPRQTSSLRQIIADFMQKIETGAEICLPVIKVPLRAMAGGTNMTKPLLRKIWKLVSHFYLLPFLQISSKSQLTVQAKNRIHNFIDQIVKKYDFTAQLTYKSLQVQQGQQKQEHEQIKRICSSILRVNEERLKQLSETNKSNNNSIQVTILGGCLSILQLKQLLLLIHSHREQFSKISERVVTRTLKIFQISPNLDVFRREKPSLLFCSLFEFRYEESIDSDYYKGYTIVYRGETLKQMLKQVLVDIENIQEPTSEHNCSLSNIFENLVAYEENNYLGVRISAQLLMKVKYLLCLLNREHPEGEQELLQILFKDLQERNKINFRLFQNTKFSLLKVYCNLRNLKNQVRHQKQSQRKANDKVRLIKKLQQLRIDFCITSKASRNRNNDQNPDKYRYRVSTADDILIQPVSECIHKENIFTGRDSHPHTIPKFIQVLASLDEVKYYLRHPTFLNQLTDNPFLYCNQTKVGEALQTFLTLLTEKLGLTQDERTVVEEIVFRVLAQVMLGTKAHPLGGFSDRCLAENMMVDKVRDCQSPRKRGSAGRKRRGSFNPKEGSDKKLQSQMHQEQLFAMGRRYLWSLGQLSLPGDKMRKLRDIVDIYKMALGGFKFQESTLDRLLTKTVAISQMPNLVSQLVFLEMFLPEDKLMSGDGRVLKKFQKAALRVVSQAPLLQRSPRKPSQKMIPQL